jgi:peptide/nickel transport system substrate-binding protein
VTRRDQGIVGALIGVFAVLAFVIALPSVDRAGASQTATPTPGASAAVGAASVPSLASPPAGTIATGTPGVSGTAGEPTASGAVASSSDPSSAAPSTSPEPPDNTIRHGVVGLPTSINLLTARTQADRDLVALVFSGLVRLGPRDTILPDLADRWTVDRTGTLWTFHIRPTATWHDGERVTADDVVFTLRLLRDPAYAGPYKGSWNEITAKKINAATVRFTLRTPLGDFLQLARQPLLPSHLLANVPVEALTDSAFSAAPVGAGPYQLLQWDSSMALLQQASVTAPAASASPTTGASADPGAGDPPRLELRFYASALALSNAYKRGEVDMADGLPAAMAQELDALPGTRIVRNPRSTLTAVLLNLRTDHPLTRDQDVRLALLKAVDRMKLVNDVLEGFGNRADSLIPPASWAYVRNSAKAVPYDTTAAAKQLKAAGWRKVNGKWHPPGSKKIFQIELVTTTKAANPVAWEAAQFVARSWRSFGITVVVKALAPNVLVGDRLAQSEFDMAVVDINIGLDPDLYPLLASRQAGIGGSNLSGVQSLVLDELLVNARKPGTLAERRGAWAKLEQFLAGSQVLLPLAFRDDPLVVSDRVTGPRPHLQGDLSDRFWDVLTWRLASAG